MIFTSSILLSSVLIGIGVASSFYRRNMLSILLSLSTSLVGLMIGFAAIDSEGALMASLLGIVGVLWLALGSAVTFRRYRSSGTFEITETNRLKN